MTHQYNIKAMMTKISTLRKNAEELKEIAGDFPSVIKNCERILADVRILEFSINEVADVLGK